MHHQKGLLSHTTDRIYIAEGILSSVAMRKNSKQSLCICRFNLHTRAANTQICKHYIA